MSDFSEIKRLINLILSDEKLTNSKNFDSTVYRDEPILRTAGQLPNYVPPEIKKMKQIANNYYSYRKAEEAIFYNQCKFMADYEDDFIYNGEFIRYFPTYQSMSTQQLRGYFSWRTKVRQGIIEPTSLSFVFVYIYELLHQIGANSAVDGYEMLKKFRSVYSEIDSHIYRYMKAWVNDYVIYYNLDKSLLEENDDIIFDKSLLVLIEYNSNKKEQIFDAIKFLSSYNIANSKFYKQYPDDVMIVACNVFIELSEYYKKHRKNTLCDKLFGRKISCSYNMFSAAVFYDHINYNNYEYVVNDIHKYRCVNGRWTCEKYFGNRDKSTELGAVIKAIDCVMRQKYDYKFPLKQDFDTKVILNIINREIDKFLEDKIKNTAPEIEIDVSKLKNIRQAAEITRDKLIIDDEFSNIIEMDFEDDIINQEIGNEININVDIDYISPVKNEIIFTDVQYDFMHLVLNNENYINYVNENHIMLSVLVDEINDKLFDIFGDTVFIFEGDTPVLIQDYVDELRGLFVK